ncbi:5-oxoprolinase subunit PxpB [Fictibacillus iocasae]|uniref:5-oxoprolinase subunit PxpB n=1 Tax=Fictibacillus iocasae TaxID=2715437 RepID=A0ABW2NLG1_9BACL
MDYTMTPLGDSAVLLQFGSGISREMNEQVQIAAAALEASPFKGMKELIPAFSTLAVEYDPVLVNDPFPYEAVKVIIKDTLQKAKGIHTSLSKTVKIPVCYESPFAMDLDVLSQHTGLSVSEIISLHTSADYYVYFLGFAPGFPFLGGMPEKLAMPRKASPREKIPAGSVGIAGSQTGVYPIETPGGWQIIGRTPLQFFDPENEEPVLISPGDTVNFYPISKEDYDEYVRGEKR